jgi:hypothetical protein
MLVIKDFFTVLKIFLMVLTAPVWTFIWFSTTKKLGSWFFQESWCTCVLAHYKNIWVFGWQWIHSRSCWLFLWSTLKSLCSLSPYLAYITYIWGLCEKPDMPMDFVLVHVVYICNLSERHGKQIHFARGKAAYIQDCSLLPEMSFVSCLFTLTICNVCPTSVVCLTVLDLLKLLIFMVCSCQCVSYLLA